MKKYISILAALFITAGPAFSAPAISPGGINISTLLTPERFSNSVQLLITLSLITLAPFFLISVTSFLRMIIVLGLIRVAVGTQQVPPNSVIIGLSLFMTVFVMTPVWQEINTKALVPYNQKKISQVKAFEVGMEPLRKFMFRQTRENDLSLFIQFSRIPRPTSFSQVPTYVLIPAFMISELKTAFQIGFLIFVPFIVIDLVVANILLSLGMFMLSPVMVSLPFKILLFVLADGWNLITRGLMMSFS
ncbi:MAG: flagellar type III secretion system pore protein FliP [Candidatus Saganbacteria bacterium]|nr:flagellar type III secretion system pore protein FliP [Candidatus Saganbacteria bacterium]